MEQISHSCLMSWAEKWKQDTPCQIICARGLLLSISPAFDRPKSVVIRLTLCPDCVSCQPSGTQLYFPVPLLLCVVDHIIFFFHPWIYFLPILLRICQKPNLLWSFISSLVCCLPPTTFTPSISRFTKMLHSISGP